MSLYESILAVMKKVGYVQKTGKVAFGKTNYKYASESDLLEALRPALVECGIIAYPEAYEVVENVREKVVKLYNGEESYSWKNWVSLKVKWVFKKDSESLRIEAFGQGLDDGDKAFNKAMTGALKYALRQTFLIETGDDPDQGSSEELTKDSAPVKPMTATYKKGVADKLDKALDKIEDEIQLMQFEENTREDWRQIVAWSKTETAYAMMLKNLKDKHEKIKTAIFGNTEMDNKFKATANNGAH